MKRIQVNLNKDQIQKLALSTIGFFVLLYVYFSFFLGPLNNSRDTAEAQIAELQGKAAGAKNEMTKAANLEKQADASTKRFAALKALNPEALNNVNTPEELERIKRVLHQKIAAE